MRSIQMGGLQQLGKVKGLTTDTATEVEHSRPRWQAKAEAKSLHRTGAIAGTLSRQAFVEFKKISQKRDVCSIMSYSLKGCYDMPA